VNFFKPRRVGSQQLRLPGPLRPQQPPGRVTTTRLVVKPRLPASQAKPKSEAELIERLQPITPPETADSPVGRKAARDLVNGRFAQAEESLTGRCRTADEAYLLAIAYANLAHIHRDLRWWQAAANALLLSARIADAEREAVEEETKRPRSQQIGGKRKDTDAKEQRWKAVEAKRKRRRTKAGQDKKRADEARRLIEDLFEIQGIEP
jgi:hypothetical protein